MPKTYVDIVDINDNLTGKTATIDEAHGLKLIHRCVAVFVFDKNGKLFCRNT